MPEDICRKNYLGPELFHVSKRMRSMLDAQIAAKVSPELTNARGMLLGYLVRETSKGRPVYQKDVEALTRVQRSSVTALLKGMEQSGFITRNAVAQDARLKSLAPTEKGLACFEAAERCIDEMERLQRKGLTEEELQTLFSILGKIMRNLDSLEPETQKNLRKEP